MDGFLFAEREKEKVSGSNVSSWLERKKRTLGVSIYLTQQRDTV